MHKQSRTKISGILVIAIALMAFMGTSVNAQDVATGSATATLVVALTVASGAALAFGNVYQGVTKAIANTDAAAGIFNVTGLEDAVLAIYFQLPDYLATATGDDRMVISFSSTDLNIDTTAAGAPAGFVAANGWIDEDPHNVTSSADIGSGGVDLYLGGRVIPSVDQTAGAYTGDIILTVAYTGS
ncbi:MAG: hypothetical protein J7J98_06260 [candidate division Zixibacteria bacterium]|nr:hypothetical protein [candidate division Zixibacteria bacterium]